MYAELVAVPTGSSFSACMSEYGIKEVSHAFLYDTNLDLSSRMKEFLEACETDETCGS